MKTIDIIGLIAVYIYIITIFIISEKFLKNKPSISRKFVHIMIGNMIFIMPLFTNPTIMIWFLTLPITIISFFLTKYSPIKIKSNVTEAGHALGLVYYAGIWTILLILLPDKLWIVGLAIASMVYGDGFASLIGEKIGKHKFNISGDVKSLEGSITMFFITFLSSVIIFNFYNFIGYLTPEFNLIIIGIISLIATITEAITPKGLDNITCCSITAILYYFIYLVI